MHHLQKQIPNSVGQFPIRAQYGHEPPPARKLARLLQSGPSTGSDRDHFLQADLSLLIARHRITVAVGTTIADRPPHRSVRARLRIRLLRRMSGVEACIGIGVQNAGWRNPPVQDWGKTFPPHLGALAAADQNTLPEPAHAKLKDA